MYWETWTEGSYEESKTTITINPSNYYMKPVPQMVVLVLILLFLILGYCAGAKNTEIQNQISADQLTT
jgi:hypothetical protein